MQLAIILGVVLGIPLVLLPIAFVWYLNVSGLLQVIRDTRQRAKRHAAIEQKITAAEKQIA
ncbi:MAG TPA: hypothetical protein VMW64_00045 [Dehalococcoidia bacterium]|nr:hypothetical protein [Dehalococcoidia bacterium]